MSVTCYVFEGALKEQKVSLYIKRGKVSVRTYVRNGGRCQLNSYDVTMRMTS